MAEKHTMDQKKYKKQRLLNQDVDLTLLEWNLYLQNIDWFIVTYTLIIRLVGDGKIPKLEASKWQCTNQQVMSQWQLHFVQSALDSFQCKPIGLIVRRLTWKAWLTWPKSCNAIQVVSNLNKNMLYIKNSMFFSGFDIGRWLSIFFSNQEFKLKLLDFFICVWLCFNRWVYL